MDAIFKITYYKISCTPWSSSMYPHLRKSDLGQECSKSEQRGYGVLTLSPQCELTHTSHNANVTFVASVLTGKHARAHTHTLNKYRP